MEYKEGEVICDKCNGHGQILWKDDNYSPCKKCRGVGKVNWIEDVFGKSNMTITIKEVDLLEIVPKYNFETFWDYFK